MEGGRKEMEKEILLRTKRGHNSTYHTSSNSCQSAVQDPGGKTVELY